MNTASRVLLSLLFGLSLAGPALASDPREAGLTPGMQYQVLPLPPQAAQDRPELVYFFWVGCKHCARLEQALPAWLAEREGRVEFRRVPAVFRPVWRLHALGYYAAEALNQGDYFLKAMYRAVTEDGHELKTREELIAFAVAEGLDKAAFVEALDSSGVKSQVLAAERLQKRYLLAGVPALVTDSHYVTNGKMAGTVSELLRITDILAGLNPAVPPAASAGPTE